LSREARPKKTVNNPSTRTATPELVNLFFSNQLDKADLYGAETDASSLSVRFYEQDEPGTSKVPQTE
jgi:hypothetical protein